MPTPNDASADIMARKRDAFLDRLLQSARGTFELFSIYIGVRLGFYEALAAGGPLSSVELASRTATSERYAREWLEQQPVSGILEVDDEKHERSAQLALWRRERGYPPRRTLTDGWQRSTIARGARASAPPEDAWITRSATSPCLRHASPAVHLPGRVARVDV